MEVSANLYGWGWSWPQLLSGWQEVEALGFDACYTGDDLYTHPPWCPVEAACFEPWAMLPAIAAVTERIRIGTMVSPAGRRNPGQFGKLTSTVDVISGGRLTVGMGSGNSPDQFASVGLSFPKPSVRAAMLAEEIEILRSLWTEDRTSYRGEHYQIKDAINFPKPSSDPHPEVMIAFSSKKLLPAVAARLADRVNMICSDAQAVEALEVLRVHCDEAGTDFDRIKKNRIAAVTFTDGEVDPDSVREQRASRAGISVDLLKAQDDVFVTYVGPADKCAETLRHRTHELGFDEVIIIADSMGHVGCEDEMSMLRTFAAQVMPELQEL